jgi:hypothetical protein
MKEIKAEMASDCNMNGAKTQRKPPKTASISAIFDQK